MGNIGHSGGLEPLVGAFERSSAVEERGIELVITGSGVAADDVRRRVKSKRVTMPGLVDDRRLEAELRRADVALVSQSHDGAEFNVPSKLMNYMAYGLPVLAVVRPGSEVARLIEESGAGWVVDSSRPERFPETAGEVRDRISGGDGTDRIFGVGGSDRISGGRGRDNISAGSGNDRIAVRDGQRDTVRCGRGRDRVTADRQDQVARDCERVSRRGGRR